MEKETGCFKLGKISGGVVDGLTEWGCRGCGC